MNKIDYETIHMTKRLCQYSLFIEESNKIEGIEREPTVEEIQEFSYLMDLEDMTISELCTFVTSNQKGARLRTNRGDNVTIGNHYPPIGGQAILYKLQDILDNINDNKKIPFENHLDYEKLHPFTDCNGRSGRMLWAWQTIKTKGFLRPIGFLHSFYYETLENSSSE